MTKLLKHHQIEAVQLLLAAGKSQREIYRETGVSRDSIRAIMRGTVGPRTNPAFVSPYKSRRNAVGRCPECGAVVRLPCLACRVRKQPKRKKQ